MLHPAKLSKGSVVRIVSPAGAIQPEWVHGADECLRDWGLDVRLGNHVFDREGRFAGGRDVRCQDLQEALDDPECQAILCSRGGYGTVQYLESLHWDAFLKAPKWLIGFSDITMLHACIQQLGICSIHGGMAKALTESRSGNVEHADLLWDILQGTLPNYHCPANALNRCGSGSGLLIGGNLSILYSLRGTPYEFIPPKSILFIEDIGEEPYVIDRMMHNLKMGGILSRISGLVVGTFSDYKEDESFGKTVYEIIADAVSDYDYPVCFGFPVGHDGRNLPLICGATAHLDVQSTNVELRF